MKNTNKLLSSALCLLLICGCTDSSGGTNDSTINDPEITGKITISAAPEYSAALSKVADRIERNSPGLEISFTDDSADIIITDRLPENAVQNCMPLNSAAEKIGSTIIPELTIKNGDDIIGLPLFLKIESYWFDRLYYQANSREIPFSLTAVKASLKSNEHCAVFSPSSAESFFWSTAAPYYIKAGGTAEELSNADFNSEKLQKALENASQLFKHGIVSADTSAGELFLSEQLMFYIADISKISAERHNFPLNSDISLAPSLIFNDNCSTLAVRSAFVTVRKSADKDLVNKFLAELYSNEILLNIIKSSEIPLACRISYDNNSVPALTAGVNSVLSSPDVGIHYINCRWNEKITAAVTEAVNGIADGNLSAAQAANHILSAVKTP